MRLRKEQRQEAVEVHIEEPCVWSEVTLQPVIELQKHVVTDGVLYVAKRDGSIKEYTPQGEAAPDGQYVNPYPAPLYQVGDVFVSNLSGLKLELMETLEYKEGKGWKWAVKVRAAGENNHHKRGEMTATFESTLISDFEQIEEAPDEPKKRGRQKKEKEERVDSAPPHFDFPNDFTRDTPWAGWPSPNNSSGSLQDFAVRESTADRADELYLVNRNTGEILGTVTETALGELGKRAQFPPDFVSKLSSVVSAQVINERIKQAKPEDVQVVFEDGKFSNILPAWRGVLSTKLVAELVYLQLKGWYPDVEIDVAERGEGWCRLRFLTPVAYPVTTAANDLLRLGLEISHQYGDTLRVSLYTRRLASGGGTLSRNVEYSWRTRTGGAGSAEAQALWLNDEVTAAICSFTAFVEKCKLMSETRFTGDAKKALVERVKWMGIAQRQASKLVTHFNAEPGETEWALVNAYTRLIASDDIGPVTSRQMMQAVGDYVATFEPGKEYVGPLGVREEE